VHLPSDVKTGDIRTRSFTGSYGNVGSSAKEQVVDARTASFETAGSIKPGEGLTIVVGWPKGIVQKPSATQSILWFLPDFLFMFPPFIVLLVMVGIWFWKGRDPNTGKSTVVAYDPPDGLSPVEVGTLIGEKFEMRDLSATIIDLAVRGYLRITAVQTDPGILKTVDYQFDLLKPYGEVIKDQGLSAFENQLITTMFNGSQTILMSKLEGKYHDNIDSLKKTAYNMLVTRKYFDRSPDDVRGSFQSPAFIIGAGGFFLLWASVPWGFSLIACAIIIWIVGGAMPRKTVNGKNALLGVQGFEEYLSRAEKETIQSQERQGYFEKFLPYAIAFGIGSRWARAFDGLQTQPPTWYVGNYGTYNPAVFGHDMDMAASHWGDSLSSTPRSSGSGSGFGGGGFSGGGGGGGGGGAW